MQRALGLMGFVGFLFAAMGAVLAADDAKDEAIKKDRQLIAGTWQAVTLEVNGNKSDDADARKLTVVNGMDGTWSLRSEGQEVFKGTSTIDPTRKPKTIDFSPTEGESKGQMFRGIYELGDTKRRLCFAPAGQDRPTDFTSPTGSERILVTFERVKAK